MSLSDLLNGLFLQSSDVSVDGSVETFATGISRFEVDPILWTGIGHS